MDRGISHFGDCRLDKTASFLHDRLVRIGPRGISVRGVGGNRAGEVRIGRFLRNRKVTVDKIVEKAVCDTAARVDNQHILAIQDTTSLRDDGSGNSLVGHATIAVEAEQGTMLGLVDMHLIERSGGGKTPPKNRPLRDKQSHRWIESMQASAERLQSAALVTVVTDREGDIFEMFACRPKGVEVLIRAAQDRLTEGKDKLLLQPEGQARARAYGRVTCPPRTKKAIRSDRCTVQSRHPQAAKEQACYTGCSCSTADLHR